jgi:hypothetical protein
VNAQVYNLKYLTIELRYQAAGYVYLQNIYLENSNRLQLKKKHFQNNNNFHIRVINDKINYQSKVFIDLQTVKLITLNVAIN